jgi:hypothetical protein
MKYRGSAFPYEEGPYSHKGMSLRDYFAAQALIALVPPIKEMEELEVFKECVQGFVKVAYLTAEAMLTQREKDNSKEKEVENHEILE